MNGIVMRHLLDGPEDGTLVYITIRNSEVVEVTTADGRELPESVVSKRDYDLAIDTLIQCQL
jgi:hypothetical protein